MSPPTSPWLRDAAVVGALGFGLAAAAAAGVDRIGFGSDVDAATPTTRIAAAVAGCVVGGLAGLVALRVTRGRLPGLLIVAVCCSVGALLAVDATTETASDEPAPEITVDGGPGTVVDGAPARAAVERSELEESSRFEVGLGGSAVLLVALGLLGAAAVFFARRTEARATGRDGVFIASDLTADTDEPVPEQHVADAVDDALRRLELDGSSAARIRAAYAAMLDGLATAGLPRHRSEPPRRYVERCLTAVSIPDRSTRELLDLFELARFSTTELGTDDVERARDSLASIGAALRTVSV